MAVESLGQRPIFASEESEYLTPNRPPVSRLAVASLVLGIISVLSTVSPALIALPILSVAVGLAAYLHIARSEALSGRALALVGLALGIAFATWTVTSVRLRDQYLYQVSSEFAKHYLDTVGEDKLLEAFELMQPEAARQVSGTSLEEHYKQLPPAEQDALAMFRKDSKTQKIVARGPGADWQLKSGVAVDPVFSGSRRIHVLMVDASQSPGIEVEVTLAREQRPQEDAGPSAASWYVVGME
ncbi:MAG: DUF4190 domain-containing protein [Aureliella sp.]